MKGLFSSRQSLPITPELAITLVEMSQPLCPHSRDWVEMRVAITVRSFGSMVPRSTEKVEDAIGHFRDRLRVLS